MRVLAIVHEADAGPGVFAEVTGERGDRLDAWRIDRGERCPAAPETYDAVLTLGGAMHAHEHEAHPWLAEEETLLRGLVGAGRPVLGVCLGSQLLARAGGGESRLLAEPEIGWYEVRLDAGGRSDPLLGPLDGGFSALQWHSCEFTLPPGAVALASSARCLQAFRLGPGPAWGIQFHAEVTGSDFESWIEQHLAAPDDDDGPRDPEALRSQTHAAIAAWNALGRGIFGRFLDQAGAAGPLRS